jgi:hypothetical protein
MVYTNHWSTYYDEPSTLYSSVCAMDGCGWESPWDTSERHIRGLQIKHHTQTGHAKFWDQWIHRVLLELL